MAGSNASIRDRLLLRPVVPVTVPGASASQTPITMVCLLCGWSFRETSAGAVSVLELRTGDASTGAVLGMIALASGGSNTQWLGDEGVLAEAGVVVARISGAYSGTLYVRV